MNKLFSIVPKFSTQLTRQVKTLRTFCWNIEDEYKGKIITRSDKHGHYLNPEEVSRRILRIICAHDKIESPENITLATTFVELRKMGMDELSKVEVFLEVEREFMLQFPDEAVERFLNLREAVEYVSKSFHAA